MIYYDPQDYGLTVLYEEELDHESYEFNIVMVWQHTDGTLYWGQDS